jgi:hypothetical protein
VFEGPLPRLEVGVREIAAATGFAEKDVLAYLLCGLPPIVPPVELTLELHAQTLPDGQGAIQRTQATMTIVAGDVPQSELNRYYRAIRPHLAFVKGRPLTELDAAFLALVDQLGGVPARGRKEFWERMRQELAKPEYQKQGFHPYRNWRSVRVKYVRLRKRLPW